MRGYYPNLEKTRGNDYRTYQVASDNVAGILLARLLQHTKQKSTRKTGLYG